MCSNYSLLCHLSISACFVTITVAHVTIIGGHIAKINEFPYHVAVRFNGKTECGGGIIGNKFILTAAHCVVEEDGEFINDHITIVAGTNHLNKFGMYTVIREVEMIYVPQDYNPNNPIAFADIAVLKLKESLELLNNRHLKRLELPRDKYETYIGKTAKITGFGWNWIHVRGCLERGGVTNPYLRFADVDILSYNQKNYNRYAQPESQICARMKHHDHSGLVGVCTGDSGGLLVYNGTTAIGVLINSPAGCSEYNSSAIYTRVSNYANFIRYAIHDKKSSYVRTHKLQWPHSEFWNF